MVTPWHHHFEGQSFRTTVLASSIRASFSDTTSKLARRVHHTRKGPIMFFVCYDVLACILQLGAYTPSTSVVYHHLTSTSKLTEVNR